jgi:DNA invertase Pin-like site-specific DNA recombinase
MNLLNFRQMMLDMRRGNYARIVVWRLDRLGRTASGLTALFDELLELGVDLVSIRDGFTLKTAAGRMLANILASVAQFETEMRAERVEAGIKAARLAGKKWGGSVKGRRIKLTPRLEREVLDLFLKGTKVTAIAKLTGLSRPTIYKVIGFHINRVNGA